MGVFWLASYPRSGSTWIRALLSAYLRPGHPTTLDRLLVESDLARRDVVDDLLGAASSDLRPDEFDRLRPRLCAQLAADVGDAPYVVKVHSALTTTAGGRPVYPPDVTAGVIYVVRDPRDVAVSLAPFLGLSEAEAVDRLADPGFATNESLGSRGTLIPEHVGTWHGHVASWLDAPGHRLLLVRYEDLAADTAGALRRVAQFVGLEIEAPEIRAAVERAAFERLRAEEAAGRFLEHPLPAPAFFRAGQAGGWRRSLTPTLAARLAERHGATMQRLGYATAGEGTGPGAVPSARPPSPGPPMTDPSTPLRRADTIMHSEVGDKTVMMDLEQGNYYGLNTVGARIWTLLDQPASIASLCSRLRDEFDVDPGECLQTVAPFVDDLVQRGILIADPDPDAMPPS